MPWISVPPEHHPLFLAALPDDPRVETMKMFGGIAAKVNGHIFAGLFGRSAMVWLPEAERAAALALEGAAPFDPMGDGRARSDKVMLPEAMMRDAPELRRWIARAFAGTAALGPKAAKPTKPKAKPKAPPPAKPKPPLPAKLNALIAKNATKNATKNTTQSKAKEAGLSTRSKAGIKARRRRASA